MSYLTHGSPYDDEEPAYYETAQICINGHAITSGVESSPETRQKFCQTCGEVTIEKCQGCGASIRGYHHVPGVVDWRTYIPPRFCHECGKQYPWTERKLAAAKAYAQDLTALTPEERVELAVSLDELIKDSSMAQVSAGRFKRLAAKAGKEAPGFFKDLLVDLVSETAKKAIWGPGT